MPRRKESRFTVPEADPYQSLDAAVADVAQTRRDRLSVKYDGVLGAPPPWFSTDIHESFLAARTRLLDVGGFDEKGYAPEELYRIIAKVIEEDQAADAHPENALNRETFLVPPRDREDIYTLAGLWKLYQLGEKDGTPLVLGEHLQSRVEQGQKYSAHQAANAKKPRGRVGGSKTTIDDLVRRLVRSHPEDSTKDLWSNFPTLLGDYQLDPKWINDNRIEYNFKEKRKRMSFGRFRNIVSDIRTKNAR